MTHDKLEIYIFDPSSLGSGCHSPKQSSRLLANTVASQMTILLMKQYALMNFLSKELIFMNFYY
ncbi:FAD/NAD(P)-binding protein [Helicobacter muridarum]|uniref:FAD/NAD(P)-binding protein n=1 Tax=Helicobacter muridarum TaxID=216 RepID=UPI0038B34421